MVQNNSDGPDNDGGKSAEKSCARIGVATFALMVGTFLPQRADVIDQNWLLME